MSVESSNSKQIKSHVESCVELGLFNPKSPTNVGAIMRSAGCFNADGVYYTGERYRRAAEYQTQYFTDTKNAEQRIALINVDDLFSQVKANTRVVCVELVEGAVPLHLFEHPQKAFYILGPEDGTLPQNIVDKADDVVYVPTTGCLNLAATVNILLYDRCSKLGFKVMGDELIRTSRDNRNRTVVR